jgi:hypothetical protein
MDVELDRPSFLGSRPCRGPDVEIQAVFVLESVIIVRLRAYRPERGIIAWLARSIVEGEVRRQWDWTTPSSRAHGWERVRDFGEAVKNRSARGCSLFNALEAAARGLEDVWMACGFCGSHLDDIFLSVSRSS